MSDITNVYYEDLCETMDECFESSQSDINAAVVTSEAFFASSVWINHFYCIKPQESVRAIPVSFLIHQNSTISIEFNIIIQRVFEAGLVNHWSDDYRNNKINRNDEIETKSLSVEDLSSAFYIGFGGIISSIILFLLEHALFLRGRYNIGRGRFVPLWIWLRNLMEGKRHYFKSEN